MPLNVLNLTPEYHRDWDDYAYVKHASIYHDSRWPGLIKNVFGHNCHYSMATENGKIVGILPMVQLKSLLFGNFLVSLPCFNYGGVLSKDKSVSDAILARASILAGDLGASHVELRHRSNKSVELPYRDDKVSMYLPLPETEDALWSSFSSKLRAQIRRPEKEGASSKSGGAELLDEFYTVFARNMRDLGTPGYPKQLFSAICEQFPSRTRIFLVRLEGQPVAAGFTIGHRHALEIPSASSLREFNRYSPNMLLYWSILKYAVDKGYTRFDFGRTTKGSGPFRFKKQWGALPQELAWHYILKRGNELPKINPDNPKYRFAVNVWRRLPMPIANLLGPHVVKHLP